MLSFKAPTASSVSRASSARSAALVGAVAQRSVRSNAFAGRPAPFTNASPVVDAVATKKQTSRRALKVVAQAAGAASPAGDKPVVVITGASSGLGLSTARELACSGKWHVVMAVRDWAKAEAAAKRNNMPPGSYTIMHLDLASLSSVRNFVKNFRKEGFPLDVLVCNAAVYLPTAKTPTFTADGFELSVGTNHLGHFLLANLMLEDLKASKHPNRRCIIVGSITGNANTLAGKIPPQANLGDLSGMASGLTATSPMIDGLEFNGAKAYKDSKVCNMLTMRELHRRYHDATGITFASLYPGCIAETGLFRNHVDLFKVGFPWFQKNITKGYVSEEEAGKRLASVVSDPSYNTSCAYWSWNGTDKFTNQVSDEVADWDKGAKMWDLSAKLVGLN